jgi:hypothetical protein
LPHPTTFLFALGCLIPINILGEYSEYKDAIEAEGGVTMVGDLGKAAAAVTEQLNKQRQQKEAQQQEFMKNVIQLLTQINENLIKINDRLVATQNN